LADVRRVKMVITGYYDVDMSCAQEDYGTTDPTEMLNIDKDNVKNYPESMLDTIDFTVDMSWEN
jgi:hypothetical protein